MAGPGKIKTRNRTKARVQITYTNPTDAEALVEIPFVMGVMSDLSGNRSKKAKEPMSKRDFANVDIDNFDSYMAKVEPAIGFRVENKLSESDQKSSMGVELTFKSMADFEPAEVVRQIEPLRKLLEAREQLHNLRAYMDGRSSAEEKLQQLLGNQELMRALSGGGKPADDEGQA